jgi:DNA polymerase-4
MEKRLEQLGLRTLGQLADLASMEGLFGRHGRVTWQRARGIDSTRVSGDGEAKSISREGTFSSDVVDPQHLRAVLRAFSESVGSQLRQQGRRCRTVTLKLRWEDFTTLSRSTTFARPISSNDAIFDAANGLLEKVRESARRPVRLIGVGASGLVDDAVQLSLEPTFESKAELLSRMFDRVRGKYGRRSLETGRTAFDKATAREESVFERNAGLSSQIEH